MLEFEKEQHIQLNCPRSLIFSSTTNLVSSEFLTHLAWSSSFSSFKLRFSSTKYLGAETMLSPSTRKSLNFSSWSLRIILVSWASSSLCRACMGYNRKWILEIKKKILDIVIKRKQMVHNTKWFKCATFSSSLFTLVWANFSFLKTPLRVACKHFSFHIQISALNIFQFSDHNKPTINVTKITVLPSHLGCVYYFGHDMYHFPMLSSLLQVNCLSKKL